MSVSAVHRQQINLGLHHLLGALQEVAGGADSRGHAQAAVRILGGGGIFQPLLDVLYGDQALQVVVIVHHQQLLDAVLVQDGLGVGQGGSHRNGDEVFLGHHFADGDVGAGFEAQIAVGEDADQLACSW